MSNEPLPSSEPSASAGPTGPAEPVGTPDPAGPVGSVEPSEQEGPGERVRAAGPGRWRLLAGAVVIAVVSAVAGALLAAPDRPGDASAEAGFSRDMSVHHTQAVQMAVAVRDNTTDAEIRLLALDITLTQQNQIGRMQDWLIQWGLPLTGTRPSMAWMSGHHTGGDGGGDGGRAAPMPGMATAAELRTLQTSRGKAAEVLFLTLMIRHHRGGVDMAEAVLARTGRQDVQDLASSIVNSQQSEIDFMQELLRQRGAPPA
ncbi:DUF305 domain-containing protein [Actinocorallia libanotica]|uniref:DUF305 domain-containing protein n=1 Tax=Actinocorallia libanotica TaxID=46162 RepID=A0ABN1Q8I0_9ACTN